MHEDRHFSPVQGGDFLVRSRGVDVEIKMRDGEVAEIGQSKVDTANEPHVAGNRLEVAALFLFQATLVILQVFAGESGL